MKNKWKLVIEAEGDNIVKMYPQGDPIPGDVIHVLTVALSSLIVSNTVDGVNREELGVHVAGTLGELLQKMSAYEKERRPNT
ncbi:hypothetical protein phi16_gp096 [Corynebacterium phage phi16]|uniref:hypothetical protein n=1 Tax=Corynebacterium glutamicum TaxID=1718 RepID=UPI000942B497|nr:hypothetical protein [Corynebacterium glutamicum]APQ42599.1 hypothetical protein phi16_gp096 [Corynebacterium phage phi16]OKX80500.1 hypothetical protein AUO95_10160 [Corynebacterium glutamicum]